MLSCQVVAEVCTVLALARWVARLEGTLLAPLALVPLSIRGVRLDLTTV